ncbi:MAG: IS4 family transposase [Planctomycetes bacterium]|nr:IS4 family transposase [Planctomycetota bacterium]
MKVSPLEVLKQCFEKVIPSQDARTKINPLAFVVSLVFCHLGDSKTFSLEAIRRHMKAQLNQDISRSAFWERLSRDRLKKYLKAVVAELMSQMSTSALISTELLRSLRVDGIWLVDSSSISLWDGAKASFPGTRTEAGIKWHASFNLLTGVMNWFKLTPTSRHDRKCFPDIGSLEGVLVIFDLGYFDYGLLFSIQQVGGFYLCRLKSNASICITEVVQGLSKKHIGKSLLSIKFKRKRTDIIEVKAQKRHNGNILNCRVIGFWNPVERSYHWYMTNLKVGAYIIYPLYRLRWQIELIFKGCKNSLNANQITSNDKNIIESLLLSSLAAQLASNTIFNVGSECLRQDQKLATSFQRILKVSVDLSSEFISFLLNSSKEHFYNLLEKIKLFSNEIFDPNYKHRETSLTRIHNLLENGA